MNNRSENAPSSSQKMSTENISEILDKMLKLQEKEKKPSFFQKDYLHSGFNLCCDICNFHMYHNLQKQLYNRKYFVHIACVLFDIYFCFLLF